MNGVVYVFAQALSIIDGSTTVKVDAGDAYKYDGTAAAGSRWTKFYGPIAAE